MSDMLRKILSWWQGPVKEYNPTKTSECQAREQGDQEIEVPVISSRTIGKEILKLCGNEGTEDTPESASLRRLLQGCITLLEQHPEKYWKNAELRVFTLEGKEYCFRSGSGGHHFVAMYDENEKLYIRKR